MKKLWDHIQLLKEYNKLRINYDALNTNFKNSAYKKVLDYEAQEQEIQKLQNEVLTLKEKLAIVLKNEKQRQAVESLKERKKKNEK